MNKLKINGSTKFMGVELPIIEGGFGKDKKCILAKDVAEIHGKELKYINKQINNNIKRFKDGIDIIDLKTSSFDEPVLEMKNQGILTQAQIGNANNIYILSERGYSKLIKILDDDKSWEVHDELIDHYFRLREQVKELVDEHDLAILKIVNAKDDVEQALAIKEYKKILVEPLEQEIDRYSRFLCDKLSTLTKSQLAMKLDTKPQTLAALFKKLKIYTPTSQVHHEFLEKFPDIKMIKETEYTYTNPKTGEKQSKKEWQWTGEGSKALVDYLIKLGKVTFTENKGFKLVK